MMDRFDAFDQLCSPCSRLTRYLRVVDMAEKMSQTYRPNNETKLRMKRTEIAHGYQYGVGVFGSGFYITLGPSGTPFCQNQHSRPLPDQLLF